VNRGREGGRGGGEKREVSLAERRGVQVRGGGPTDDGGDALVSGYCLFVVALAPLEGLGEVHGRLLRLALEI